jgi:hypothetical protein
LERLDADRAKLLAAPNDAGLRALLPIFLVAMMTILYGPPVAQAETPWENRRGFETIDYNNSLAFVRAPIDEVGRALADRTERWEHDVLGKEIVVGDEGRLFSDYVDIPGQRSLLSR